MVLTCEDSADISGDLLSLDTDGVGVGVDVQRAEEGVILWRGGSEVGRVDALNWKDLSKRHEASTLAK